MSDNIQYRSIDNSPLIADNIVSGYALVFNKLSSDVGGYRELIRPEAISSDILDRSDIFCYLNHDETKGVLERRRFGRGGLELIIDETGLLYRFKLGDSPLCRDLRYYLDRGIITKSSFSFTVSDYRWLDDEDGNPVYDEDGLQQMDILKFDRIFDVSPVFEPAYAETSVSMNSKHAGNPAFIEECENRKAAQSRPDDDYYINLRKKYRIHGNR